MKTLIEHRKALIPNFKVEELVPKEVLNDLGDLAILCMDVKLLITAQALRNNLGKAMTINNYLLAKKEGFSQRGLRTPTSPYFKKTSLHSSGQAIDFTANDMTADEVRLHILTNLDKYPYLKGLETGCSWVHVDVRESKDLVIFPEPNTKKHANVEEYLAWLKKELTK